MHEEPSVNTSKNTIAEFISELGDIDNNTQFQAECCLIRIGGPAVGQLIEATKHPIPQVRWRAAFSLGEIGDRRAYPFVLALLDDENSEVRADAVDAVGKIGGVDAIEPLSKVVLDAERDAHAATHAAWRLMWMGKVALPALLEIWRTGGLEARREVLYPLAKIGDPVAIEPLSEKLDDPDLRFDVADALGMLGDSRGLDILIDSLRDDSDEDEENDPQLGLIGIGVTAIESLMQVVRDGSERAKKESIRLLGEIGNPLAIDRLTQLLDDPVLDRSALIALGKCGDKRVLPKLLELMNKADDDWDPDVAVAVARFGDVVIYQLENIANSGGKYSRQAAASALGAIASEESIDALEHMLGDPDDNVREWVSDALWEIGSTDLARFGQRCADLIEMLLDDRSKTVRERTASWSCSLREDLGEPFHPLAWSLVGNY